MVGGRVSDDTWEQIADAFPPHAAVGRRGRPPAKMVDAILYVLRAGGPWRDLPYEFGPWQSVNHWFDVWSHEDTLDEELHRLVATHVDVVAIVKTSGASIARTCGPLAAQRAAGKRKPARAN